jgi:hypothetical protein
LGLSDKFRCRYWCGNRKYGRSNKSKYRAVVYYLLAVHFKRRVYITNRFL